MLFVYEVKYKNILFYVSMFVYFTYLLCVLTMIQYNHQIKKGAVMQDMQTVIVLLSVIVGLLSIVILALLGVLIALLTKLRQVAKRVDEVTTNIAKATEWLSPSKLFGEIASLFKRK